MGWKCIYCGFAYECERGDDVGLGEAEVLSCACGQIRADAQSASWETRDGGHSAEWLGKNDQLKYAQNFLWLPPQPWWVHQQCGKTFQSRPFYRWSTKRAVLTELNTFLAGIIQALSTCNAGRAISDLWCFKNRRAVAFGIRQSAFFTIHYSPSQLRLLPNLTNTPKIQRNTLTVNSETLLIA